MSFGSSPAGQAQTINPVQAAQQPFLQTGWEAAKNLLQNNPIQYYPGQTLADYRPVDPSLIGGYNLANQAAAGINQMLPAANTALATGLGGAYGGQFSPAYGGYQQFAGGTAAPQQALADYAARAAGPNAGLNQLMSTASGQYLNSNPYLDAMFKSASDPVARAYQTTTAPTTDARFSAGGRYGSGAAAGAQGSNELNLGKTLSDLSTGIYGANYARERQAQDTAAQAFGQLTNQGLQLASLGQSAIGSQQQTGLAGLQSGFDTGNRAQQQALQMYPAIANAALIGPQAQISAGKGLTEVDQTYRQYQQQQFEDAQKRFLGEQEAPYATLSKYMNLIGNPQPGSSSKDYFRNPFGEALSGIGGAIGVGNQLGLGSLFGGGGATATSALAGADAALLGDAIASSAGALTAGGFTGAAGLGTAAAAAEGGGFLASLLPFIFSDRRLKEDDKVVGQVGDLPIHTFRYKGDDMQRIGFMADEVEKIDPGAVVTTGSGYKAVDYGRAFGSALNSMMSRKKAA